MHITSLRRIREDVDKSWSWTNVNNEIYKRILTIVETDYVSSKFIIFLVACEMHRMVNKINVVLYPMHCIFFAFLSLSIRLFSLLYFMVELDKKRLPFLADYIIYRICSVT